LLRAVLQYRHEIEADQMHEPLLLRARPFDSKLMAENAGGFQLGRGPVPEHRTAPGDAFLCKEIA
jgi:hypothetical protein